MSCISRNQTPTPPTPPTPPGTGPLTSRLLVLGLHLWHRDYWHRDYWHRDYWHWTTGTGPLTPSCLGYHYRYHYRNPAGSSQRSQPHTSVLESSPRLSSLGSPHTPSIESSQSPNNTLHPETQRSKAQHSKEIQHSETQHSVEDTRTDDSDSESFKKPGGTVFKRSQAPVQSPLLSNRRSQPLNSCRSEV